MAKKGAYEKAGVNRDLADKFVGSISTMVKSTLNKNVKSSVGGYASLYAVDSKKYIAASTDGVGTKLKLAFDWNSHDTVGVDLVAMSVNDLLCVGAKPLFFLDYFATGKLAPKTAKQVLSGIVDGCREARCALIGGETAEMPGFYQPGEYDLAGFAVGMVDKSKVLPLKSIQSGDVLIGISSAGFHSNGFSLVRKLFKNWKPDKKLSRAELAKELLKPTQIYTRAVEGLIEKNLVKGLAHITGSGFLNVPRMSNKVSYEIYLPPINELPKSYHWLESLKDSSLTFEEKVQTFNMGIGMVIACEPKKAKLILAHLKKNKFKAWDIGSVTRKKKTCEVRVYNETEMARLVY
ncbi:MAG: phosphoribosylformylglycinamidine cyclo-ligase [Bdellovibrionaceae bacterium]|nr:phosphoribosylformylglycinamidine cyclo-ligase [Pseudobdellovibrionaceae bacterium]